MKTMKKSRRAAFAGAVLALAAASPALAASTPAPGTAGVQNASGNFRGTDGIVDQLRMGGSDTTYDVMQGLASLYNGSVGCTLATNATYCATASAVTTENSDHDVVANEFPTGSGNGRAKLLGNLDLDLVAGTDTDPNFRIARSSGAPTESGLFGAAFAKDGIAIVGFFGNSHNPSTRVLSLNNLKAIFAGTGPQAQPNVAGTGTCATNWSQLIDPTTGTAFPAQPIKPFGLQTGSGTYSFFKSYLGGDDPDICPAKTHGGGANFFENNTAPIDGGTDTNGTVYAAPDAGRANAIWFMSSAVAIADPVAQGTATAYVIRRPGVAADGTAQDPNIDQLPTKLSLTAVKGTNGAYDVQRKLYIVLKNADMNPGLGAGWTGDTGPGGAAASFRNWLCRRSGHATAPKDYNALITKIVEDNGMVRLLNSETSANPFAQAGDPAEKCANVSNP